MAEHNGHQRRVRMAIADDDPTVLGEIGRLLGTHFDIVASAANGRELVEAVRKFSPAAVVVDVSMPVMNGIQAARAISAEWPGIRIVMLSVHDDPDYIDAAFEAGAAGYVLKISATQELVPAIEQVLAGGSHRPSEATNSG